MLRVFTSAHALNMQALRNRQQREKENWQALVKQRLQAKKHQRQHKVNTLQHSTYRRAQRNAATHHIPLLQIVDEGVETVGTEDDRCDAEEFTESRGSDGDSQQSSQVSSVYTVSLVHDYMSLITDLMSLINY